MRRSQVDQAHSTKYHPQTSGLVERQNRTLMSMLGLYCSKYMIDWDRYLAQVMGALNSTQHSTTGISPHMMLSGHQKSLPLIFFYPVYAGKNTSPQVYVRDEIRRQQELNYLCRRNTQQAQARQRKRFDKKTAGAKAYSEGDYVWAFQNVIPPKGTKKLLNKWMGPFMITEVHQEGRFHRLSTGRAAHFENIKPHNPSTENWCIPEDMEEGNHLMMDPACEVNDKGTRDKNDGNEALEEGTSPPLDLDHKEIIEADEEVLPYAEKDLLLRSNLVQQELSGMNISSLSLLDRTVQVTPQVVRMLGRFLVREVTRDDPEWAAAMVLLTVSEKVRIKTSRRQHQDNERDCRTVVQQLVSSIPRSVLVRTSFKEKRQEIRTEKKTVTFEEPDKEWIEVEPEKPEQENLSGESDVEESGHGLTKFCPGS